jgi:O-antigen/teichoic acid export membrane protein
VQQDTATNAASSAEFRRRFVLFLLPGLYQAALPFLTLPLTTRILGPADFALFSVANAISAVLITIAQLGSVFILAQRFSEADRAGRRVLVSTIFYQCLALSAIFGILLLVLWPTVRGEWSVASGITEEMIVFVAVAMVGSSLYTLVGTLAVFGHAPGYYALATMIKATVSVVVVLVSLFVFGLQIVSLFLGLFAAGLVDLISAVLILKSFLAWRFDPALARDCLFLGGWNGLAQLTMQGRQLVERGVLSSTVGLHDLGLFIHAQQYQNYAMLGARPIQQAVIPVMLKEAGESGAAESEAAFQRTERVTRVLFVALTVLALVFAFLGEFVIHLMTNGKFDAAAPYAALLIGTLLLQAAGRPQLARLLSRGRGRYLSISNIAAVAGAVLLLVLLAPQYGIAAAVAAIYMQYALFRLGIELDALRSGRLPFQDFHAIIGVALVGGSVAVVQIWSLDLPTRTAFLLMGVILTAVINRSVLGDLIRQGGQFVRPLSGLVSGRRGAG